MPQFDAVTLSHSYAWDCEMTSGGLIMTNEPRILITFLPQAGVTMGRGGRLMAQTRSWV